MSGRAPDPTPLQTGNTFSRLLSQSKIRIMLPVVLAVVGLTVFLIAFWPGNHHSGKSGYRSDRRGDANRSPVGGSYREDRDDRESRESGGQGNSGTGSGGGSPVGGDRARPRSNGAAGGWWYQDNGSAKRDKHDEWWYHEKAEEPSAPANPELADNGPGERKSKSKESEPPKAGPDDTWWRD